MSYRPIFVFGLARSGTNLLARILNSHPSVTMALDPLMPIFRSLRNIIIKNAGDPELRRRFDPRSAFQDYYFDPDGPTILDLMLAGDLLIPLDPAELVNLRERTAARASLESQSLGLRLIELDGSDYKSVICNALKIFAEHSPGAIWVGSKELWTLEFTPMLARVFPDARFYAIERDPRAILASLVVLSAQDPTQAAHEPSYLRHWRKNIVLARRFSEDITLKNVFQSVQYEQLVLNPEKTVSSICDQLGLEFQTEMLQVSSYGWNDNSSYVHSDRNIFTRSIDRWRTTLPASTVRAVDFLCGPEMQFTTYKISPERSAGETFEFLTKAEASPGSWKSNSDNMIVDFGGELARHQLLSMEGSLDPDFVRKCFLFQDTFVSLRDRRGRTHMAGC